MTCWKLNPFVTILIVIAALAVVGGAIWLAVYLVRKNEAEAAALQEKRDSFCVVVDGVECRYFGNNKVYIPDEGDIHFSVCHCDSFTVKAYNYQVFGYTVEGEHKSFYNLDLTDEFIINVTESSFDFRCSDGHAELVGLLQRLNPDKEIKFSDKIREPYKVIVEADTGAQITIVIGIPEITPDRIVF